jgi:hypothetical protein
MKTRFTELGLSKLRVPTGQQIDLFERLEKGCQSAWERDPGSACKRDPL